MTFLLIIPAWLLLMSLLAGLCMAARAGDELREQSYLGEQTPWGGSGSQAGGPVVARPGSARKAPSTRERTGVGIAV